MTIFKSAVNSTLAYGCHSIHLNRRHLKELDAIQFKLLKCILGLNKFIQSSHLLQALRIIPISTSIQIMSLDLLQTCVSSDSATSQFYSYLLCTVNKNHVNKLLVGRVLKCCKESNINIFNYLFDNEYRMIKKKYLSKYLPDGVNGVVDTLRYVFKNYTSNNRDLAQNILKPIFT